MGINNRLYDRGHEGYDKSIGSKLLYISGSLPPSIAAEAYEHRLQIHNAVGSCSVNILSSTNLPDGSVVYVDNTTSEVVVSIPAKTIIPVTLVNPGFETGDLTGWTYSTNGGDGILSTSSSYKDGGMCAAYWAGGKGLGSEGGIECLAVNDTKGPVKPGQMVTAKLRVMYNPGGGTPKGSRGQVRLQWYDDSDNLLKVSEGYLIKTRTYNGKWTDTVVSDRAVPGSAYVKFASWVTATGAGHTYFDNASWDIASTTDGTITSETIDICIRVSDAGGRVADWCGQIPVFNGIATFDPASAYLPYAVLSDGNLTVRTGGSSTSIVTGVLTNSSRTSGKIYWEITAANLTASQSRSYYGITNVPIDIRATTFYSMGVNFNSTYKSASLGGNGKGYAEPGNGSGTSIGLPGFTTGAILRFKLDLDLGIFEAAVNGSSWATITNTLPSGLLWRASIDGYYGDFGAQGGTANFGSTPFVYPVPDGYQPGWYG